MKLGIAFAGGGLKGIAYIGVFKALEELGIKPDYMSGTSSGSMTTALYAAGYSRLTTVLGVLYTSSPNISKCLCS